MDLEFEHAKIVVFDSENSNEALITPLTYKRTLELEETLGKALLERFQKEIALRNLKSENI